jgi:CheY-like chemotaxis protein
VRDSGIGIAPEAIPALFEPFRQADGTMARRYGGTGLGLSISKALVELMGGSIGVQSAPATGSTFSFTLNFKRAQNQPPEPPNLTQMRALVIDDDPIAQEIFARYMTSWHMRCDTVGDAASACRLAQAAAADADPYDVILVDLVMPEMDGLEFARQIQSTIDLSHTRLIMVTAYDEPERGRTAIAAGFSAYLTKPVRQSQLYDCIVNASSGSNLQGSPASRSAEPHRGRRILVAEDNAVNREVALRQLGKLGYAAQTVADGREAVEAALSGQFDVVLMDCQMPVMDGFQATRAIRKGEARSGRRVRIVAMTANALAEDRQACLDAGMDDYLAKPVTLGALQQVLRLDNGSGPLDIGRLNELFEGDREGMNEFLASALPALLRLVKRLEDARQVSERLAVAHELKGAAANVGALEIAQIAADIETALRSDADVTPLITQLFGAYEGAVNGAHALEHQT